MKSSGTNADSLDERAVQESPPPLADGAATGGRAADPKDLPLRDVAVITRTKERPLLLPRAMESVLGQTFQGWTHVIVNDGGDPAPIEELARARAERYRDRLRIIHNPRSLGMEAASNVGIGASESQFLVIHDDDDSWHPDFLEVTTGRLHAGPPDLGGVITRSIRVDEKIENGQVVERRRRPYNPNLSQLSILNLATHNHYPPISFLFRRQVLEDVGAFREDLPVLGDWEFNLRVIQKYNLAVIPRALAYYHWRDTTPNGQYSNSVVNAKERHDYYDSVIRNDLIRRDLERGSWGIGSLVAFAPALTRIQTQTHRLSEGNVALLLKDKLYNLAKKLGFPVKWFADL